jgi:hypothetical protein
MEDKNGWKRLEEHLLARLARAGWADLHGLGPRDACERVLNGVYRIGLSERFGGGKSRWKGRKEGKRTWILSWSDRQSSTMTVSGWFGARTVERNFPPNTRIRGDSTYSRMIRESVSNVKPSAARDEVIGAPSSLVFPPQVGLTETPRLLLLRMQQ